MGILDWLRTPPQAELRHRSSPATAIVVNTIHEEYAWIRQQCPDWHIRVRRCDEIGGRRYDIVTLRRDHGGGERQIFFDISSFMPPGPPTVSGRARPATGRATLWKNPSCRSWPYFFLALAGSVWLFTRKS